MLADRFTLSDNFISRSMAAPAPTTSCSAPATQASGAMATAIQHAAANQIANPNPVAGTVNQYTADNSFSACADVSQPGVKPIVTYLENLPYAAEPNCQPNHYYMLDNTNPGYLPNGALSGAGNLPPSPSGPSATP